jgi:HlyD family secretion protein
MAKKKNNNWIIYALLVVIAIGAAFAMFKNKGKKKGLPVEFGKVEKRTIIEKVAATGKIFPETEIKITSDVSGEIVALNVEEGDSVKQGQLVARIDPDAFQSAVERGEASVNNAKAQVANSRSNAQSAKAQIAQTAAQKDQIIAQYDNLKAIHERNKSLFADGVISQADFEASQSNLDAVNANLKSADASLLTANANFESAQQAIKAAEYTVKSQEASLRELKTNLRRTSLFAPTDGVISMLSVEQGERVVGTIQMSGTELMRIANMNIMEVQVEVNESDVLKVKLGDEVDIEVDAYQDRSFKGEVTQVANSASNATGATVVLTSDQVTNFVVTIRMNIDSYKDLLGKTFPFRPGMSASVDIYTRVEKDVLTVPIQAVTIREDKDKEDEDAKNDDDIDEIVFIYDGADTVRTQVVTTGIQDDDYIQIKSGLSEGEEIVVGPYSAISRKLEVGSQVYEKEDDKKDNKDK